MKLTIRNFTTRKQIPYRKLGLFLLFLGIAYTLYDKINTFSRKRVDCTKHEL